MAHPVLSTIYLHSSRFERFMVPCSLPKFQDLRSSSDRCRVASKIHTMRSDLQFFTGKRKLCRQTFFENAHCVAGEVIRVLTQRGSPGSVNNLSSFVRIREIRGPCLLAKFHDLRSLSDRCRLASKIHTMRFDLQFFTGKRKLCQRTFFENAHGVASEVIRC